MSGIHPGRVSVLAVGIESYDYGDEMQLPGAAEHAAGFVRWAARCGVPSERIVLATTTSVSPEPRTPVPSEVREIVADSIRITRAITDLGHRPGDLLLMYWCGHGVLDGREGRALFTADALPDTRTNFRVDDILNYLSSTSLTGHGRQIVLVDACANFVEDLHLDSSLPRGIGLPRNASRAVEQFVLFSAAQGQIAESDPSAQQSGFSAAVLPWLGTQDSPDIDVTAMWEHVDRVFDDRRKADENVRQTPVYRSVRTYRGVVDVRRYGGGMPVSGETHRAARRNELSISQAQRVCEMALALPVVRIASVRAEVVQMLGLSGPVDNDVLERALVDAVAHGRIRELIGVLDTNAGTSAHRGGVHSLKEFWGRHEMVAPAVRALGNVRADEIRAAYHRAVPTTDTGRPNDLEDAMARSAAYGPGPADDQRPVHRFAALLEHATGRTVPDGWFALPTDRLAALRRAAATTPPGIGRLVVDLRGLPDTVPDLPGPAVGIRGHLHHADTRWSHHDTESDGTLAGTRVAIEELIDWAHDHDAGPFGMGFVVTRATADLFPESWLFGTALEDPSPLWEQFAVVLHSAERFTVGKTRRAWERRAKEIEQRRKYERPQIRWLPPEMRADPASIRRAVEQATEWCVGLAFCPGTYAGSPRTDPILAMVAAGAPYVVWTVEEPSDWDRIHEDLTDVLETGPFGEAPTRLRHRRADRTDELGTLLRVVWDDPDTLPGTGLFGGIDNGTG